MMPDEVILMSGIDSLVAYHLLDRTPLPVYFRWGFETDEAEIAALPTNTVILDIPEYARIQYKKSDAVMDLRGRDTVMVNLVFQAFQPNVVYKGSLRSELHYTESSLEWCSAIGELWSNVLQKRCQVTMPLIELDKRDVLEKAYALEIDMSKMQYCYNEVGNCGKCAKCMLMRLCTIFTPEPDYDYIQETMNDIEDGVLDNQVVSEMIGLRDAYAAMVKCLQSRY